MIILGEKLPADLLTNTDQWTPKVHSFLSIFILENQVFSRLKIDKKQCKQHLLNPSSSKYLLTTGSIDRHNSGSNGVCSAMHSGMMQQEFSFVHPFYSLRSNRLKSTLTIFFFGICSLSHNV